MNLIKYRIRIYGPSIIITRFIISKFNNKTKTCVKYVTCVKYGTVPSIQPPHFMTEKEYLKNRTQYERDKYPEMYQGVARIDGRGIRPTIPIHHSR